MGFTRVNTLGNLTGAFIPHRKIGLALGVDGMAERDSLRSGRRSVVRKLRRWLWLLLIVFGLLSGSLSSWQAQAENNDESPAAGTVALVLRLVIEDDAISPATVAYVAQGLEKARRENAQALLLELDTPGGYLDSTHRLVKQLLNAPVPVIVYVTPTGARAASAGVFITLAGHVAAMSPGTHIGAAHPVDANGQWPTPDKGPAPEKPMPETQQPQEVLPSLPSSNRGDSVMSEKVMNDTVAFARSIARTRRRNADWAAQAVEKSVSVTAEEAKALKVVDLVAASPTEVLQQANGRVVWIQNKPWRLAVSPARIETYRPSFQQEVLAVLSNPILCYILLMVGFYGLLFEVTHPGTAFPGIIGAVALVLALLGMQAMPVNMAGLGLVGLALILFAAEFFTAGFGLLFAAGVLCLLLGTFFLYNATGDPYLQSIVLPIVVSTGVLAIITGIIMQRLLKFYHGKAKPRQDRVVGRRGEVVSVPTEAGDNVFKIRVYGEIWDAVSDTPVSLGESVEVLQLDRAHGMRLVVSSATETEAAVQPSDFSHPKSIEE